MSILSSLSRYAADYRQRRRRLRTYMQIADLPAEIQKDIGWRQIDAPYEPAPRHLQQLGR